MLLIEGWNDDAQSSNGAGKSSVLSAVSWCLYGKIPRSVTSSSITRSGEKSTSVSLECRLGDENIIVQRTRGPNVLNIGFGGDDLKQVDQQQLDQILGITYDRFLQIVYFAQGLGQRFLDLSDTDKKQLFLDLSGSADYSAAKQIVDTKLKTLISERRSVELKLAEVTAKLDELSSIQVDTDSLSQQISVLEDKRVKQLAAIKSMNESNQEPDLSQHKDVLKRLRSQLSKIQEAKGELKQLHSQLRQISAPIEKPAPLSCPHCDGAITIDDDLLVPCNTAAIDEAHAKLLAKQEAKLDQIKIRISEVDLLVSKEERTSNAITQCEHEMKELSAAYIKAGMDIERYSLILDKTSSDLGRAKLELDRALEMSSRIATLNSKSKALSAQVSALSIDILVLEDASSVLGPSGVQAYVLDSVIDQFNEYVRECLQKTWPSMTYELLSFKENKSGSLSTRFSDSVTIDGRSTTIGEMSGGERRCLSIAIDLALSKVYSLYSGQVVSPLILDEPFNDMDSANRERAVSILQDMANDTPIVVVDHANEVKGLFDHIVTIEKKAGISTIRVQ